MDFDQNDVWSCMRSQAYFVQKAFLKLIGTCESSPWFKWMRKSCCRSILKFFFWLVLRGRIKTINLLKRKNRHLDSYTFVLCSSQLEEISLHLLFDFDCSFSESCWQYLGNHWNTLLLPDSVLMQTRRSFNFVIFREILIVGCWTIWCHRNSIIFLQRQSKFK